MKVLKFGGSSVGTPERIKGIIKILKNYYLLSEESTPMNVVSSNNRFKIFMKEDMKNLEKEVKKFAINYTYFREGKRMGFYVQEGDDTIDFHV